MESRAARVLLLSLVMSLSIALTANVSPPAAVYIGLCQGICMVPEEEGNNELASHASMTAIRQLLLRQSPISGSVRTEARYSAASIGVGIEPTDDTCWCDYELLRQGMGPYQWAPSNDTTTRRDTEYRVFNIQQTHSAHRKRALKCLEGRHIVLIGDSVMRYQYLNLAKWVETGSWLGPEPWIEIEADFKNWTHFFQHTNGVFNGHELCDCFRDEISMELATENRYYWHPGLDIRLTYLQLFKHEWGLRGHNLTWLEGGGGHDHGGPGEGLETENDTGCAPGTCDPRLHPYQWHGDVLQMMEQYVGRELRPSDLVFNTGLWGQSIEHLGVERLRSLGPQIIGRRSEGKIGSAYFKTTTSDLQLGPGPDERLFAAELENGGWRILEADRYTHLLGEMGEEEAKIQGWDTSSGMYQQFRWDTMHFQPQTNAGVNQVLLNMICPGACPSRRKAAAIETDEQIPESQYTGGAMGVETNRTQVIHKEEDYWTSGTSVRVPWRETLCRQSGLSYRDSVESGDRHRVRALRGGV